jgi:hypothetical protein
VSMELERIAVSFQPGERFPDLELPDHTGRLRSLSEIAGGYSLVCLTTLAIDSVDCGGAVTVTTNPSAFAADPFARSFRGHRSGRGSSAAFAKSR